MWHCCYYCCVIVAVVVIVAFVVNVAFVANVTIFSYVARVYVCVLSGYSQMGC